MDNLVNIKPHIIIQARMGSTRLPSKVMMPINNIPMIGYQLDRLLNTGFPIVLATSNNSNNNGLVEYAKKKGIQVIRGSEKNVLQRYYKAAKLNKATDVIRITGDNPLVDGYFIKEQLNSFRPSTRRYYFYEGQQKKLPLGMSFELFSFELLEEAYFKAGLESEREHVTPYMHQNFPGNIEILEFQNHLNFPDARLTVDTAEDFELIKRLIVDYDSHLKSTKEIIDILKSNNALMKINNDIVQKKWTE
ncbi:glycosyltransferase family protein [Polaribacter haliotis]|uniref:Glycosyltransferase family protein n=1 Tax=Polaribacter haliotis TaxID=1888915 RepID=A0A7L8AJD7_9FLAO|nr:glycosyltransferase family protein [Polaribacter haliotis]QOD62084.1 glycosyltransferase family protein [Polaribacter haliotis]